MCNNESFRNNACQDEQNEDEVKRSITVSPVINWDRVECVYEWMVREENFLYKVETLGVVWLNFIGDSVEIPTDAYTPDLFGNWEPCKPPLAKKLLTEDEKRFLRYCWHHRLHPNILRLVAIGFTDIEISDVLCNLEDF